MLLNLLFTWALYLHLPSCLPAAWTTAYAVEWSPDVGPKKKSKNCLDWKRPLRPPSATIKLRLARPPLN